MKYVIVTKDAEPASFNWSWQYHHALHTYMMDGKKFHTYFDPESNRFVAEETEPTA